MLAAVGVGRELLVTILDPAYRPAGFHCQPGDADFLGQQDALVAKAPAHIGRHHADATLVYAQAFGQTGAHDVRHLRRGVDGELLEPAVIPGEHAATFHRRHRLARGADAPLHADGRSALDVAKVSIDQGFQKNIVAPLLMHQRGRGVDRRDHVGHRRQCVVIDLNQGGEIFGVGARGGDTHRHHLTNLAYFAAGKHRLR